MHHSHMGGRRQHGFHFLLKFLFIMLVIGALFSSRGRGQQSAYWHGFQAGVASVTQGDNAAESGQFVPPAVPNSQWDGPQRGPMGGHWNNGWNGPGFAPFFLLPLCALPLLGFMALTFAMSRGRRHGGSGGKGSWGRGCWGDDEVPNGRQVDDDEIGPEKSPEDII